MLLNGWKEIANYLKSGIRTAQRWHLHLHMPVSRVREGKRGPVIVESSILDEWMKRRSTTLSEVQRTSAVNRLKGQTRQLGYDFLRIELATGASFARLAKGAMNASAATRRKMAARIAYDSIERHFAFTQGLSKAELDQFNSELRDLKSELQELGETF